MSSAPRPTLTGFRLFAVRWWQRRPAAFNRSILLGLLALLSLPAGFVEPPDMGIDPSWMQALQIAATQGKIFGQEFVFTYGPLGYLFIHADVNKVALLLYDLFVLFSLGSLYRALLPPKPAWLDWVQLILLAVITKACLWNGSPTVLFGLLCYWLWSVQEKGRVLSLVGTLIALRGFAFLDH